MVSCWEVKCLVMTVVHLSAKPSMLGTSDCHTALCNSDTVKRVCRHSPTRLSYSSTEKARSIDMMVNRKEQQPSWQSNRSDWLGKFGSQPQALHQPAPFPGLDSVPVDLFASSVPQRECLRCLCAKLNIGFLLGNLIFHRPGSNLFLREPQSAISRRNTLAGESFPLLSS